MKQIKVGGCFDCPFRHYNGMEVCSLAEKTLRDFIGSQENYSPDWCPLGEDDVKISAKYSEEKDN